jgi:protein SCO1
MNQRVRRVVLSVGLSLGCLLQESGVVARERAGDELTPDLERHVGEQVPLSARFRSSIGEAVALGDVLRSDRPTLMVLAYNRCTMLCSLVLRSVARTVADLGIRPGDQYSLVTVSIDPSETVHEAARLQAALIDAAGFAGQPQRWSFLVGDKAEIDAVANAVGFRYSWDESTEQYAHPAVVFTLAPGGKVSGYFDGLQPDRQALRAALTGVSGARAASLAGAILECFRFEAVQTRHGAAVVWSLRAGAAAVAIGLIVLLVWLGRGARRRAEAKP